MDIIILAKEIRNDFIQNKTVPNNDNQKSFKDRYLSLFNMITKPDMDEAMFVKFCKLSQLVNSGECSSFDGAAQFSEFGAKKYIYNKFEEPSQEEKENAYTKLNKQS